MRLALQNIRTVQTGNGPRLAADLVALDYGFDIEVSVWADLLSQYGPDLTKLAMVKGAVLAAQDKYDEKRAAGEKALADAQALPDDDENKAAQVAGAQAYLDALTAFKVEMDADIPVRVGAFYEGLIAKYTADGDLARVAHCQDEWDAWTASQVDGSALAGEV